MRRQQHYPWLARSQIADLYAIPGSERLLQADFVAAVKALPETETLGPRFFDDLLRADGPGLIGANLSEVKVEWMKGWESISHLPDEFKLDVWYLTQVEDYLSRMRKTPEILRSEINLFEGSTKEFLEALEDTPASGFYRQNPSGVWNLDPFSRGRAIEKVEGQNLHEKFPIIDRYDPETRVATSIKSTDLYARTYQSMDFLEAKWKSYIDDLAGMPPPEVGLRMGDEFVVGYEKQVLKIAVPDPLNVNQQRALASAKAYGKGKGVNGSDIEITISVIE